MKLTDQNPEESPFDGLPEDERDYIEYCLLTAEDETELTEDEFPDRETLVRFADGTMTASERPSITRLAKNSGIAATLIGGVVQEFTPIRNLVWGWFGWKGAILAGLNRLPDNVSRAAWDEHCGRCERDARRTRLAAFVLAPFRKTQPARLVFAATPWCLALAFAVLFFIKPARNHGIAVIGKGTNAVPITNLKEGVGPSVGTAGDRVALYEKVNHPNPNDEEELSRSISIVEADYKKHPDDASDAVRLAKWYGDYITLVKKRVPGDRDPDQLGDLVEKYRKYRDIARDFAGKL